MGKLDRRIAVVTGAATGLGKAIALLYAAEGADVAVIDRNADGAARTAAAITEQGRRSLAVGADVGDEAAVDKAFTRITSEFGTPHILVNNAGIATVALLENMATAMWDEMLRINLKSVFLCTRGAAGHAPQPLWPGQQRNLRNLSGRETVGRQVEEVRSRTDDHLSIPV